MVRIELQRVQGDYGFKAKDENGNTLQTDTSIENGGTNFGVRPMQTLLMALGSCSAIDIVSILKKQRQQLDEFEIKIEGEREKGKEPSLWKKIHMHFILKGKIDPDKAQKACTLSVEKYCSVAETLRRAGAAIEWNVTVSEIKN
ncbi:MAG: OsmC family protein [Flavisolibacter sp.]